MSAESLMRVVGGIYEAALDPDSWQPALASLADAAGAVGACWLIRNKPSQTVECINFSGPCAEMKADYMAYYGALDPYTPTVAAAPSESWLWLSESVPQLMLRNNEWYNEFVVKNGIGDILGGKLFENETHDVMFGLHRGPGQSGLSPADRDLTQRLMDPLKKAARLHVELHNLQRRSCAATAVLDQLSTAVVLVGADGAVFDLNTAAERIMREGDGLTVRNGKLAALRSSDQAKLAAAIAATLVDGHDGGSFSDHLLVGRREGQPAYALTVTSLRKGARKHRLPLAMVLVVDPKGRIPSKEAVARLFGLSPAESRVAVALMRGKRLSEIALESGLEITTLRTQLSSILKKVGVERQTDLARVLATVGFISPDPS
jgi:DNA-binding NarL/FixJ family response regulator